MSCPDLDGYVARFGEMESEDYAIRYQCMVAKYFVDCDHVSRLNFLKEDLDKAGLEYLFSAEIFSEFKYEDIPRYLYLKVNRNNVLSVQRKFEEIRANCRDTYDILYWQPEELSPSETREIFKD